MKWPWVSRERYDDQITYMRAWADTANAQYNDLLARYHMLRMQGHVPVAPPAPKPPTDDLDLAITRAIREQSKGNAKMAKMMRQAVAKDRTAGLDDVTILEKIEGRTPLNQDEGIGV